MRFQNTLAKDVNETLMSQIRGTISYPACSNYLEPASELAFKLKFYYHEII